MLYDFPETFAYAKIKNFVCKICEAIKQNKQTTSNKVQNLLNEIELIITGTPRTKTKDRFGNAGFVLFIEKLRQNAENLLKCNIFENKITEVQILCTKYLEHSFGNTDRIDFGTGHELNFICMLFHLYEDEKIAITDVLNICKQYIEICKTLIIKYNMEPAGSYGVWGIDDYQILPFLLGSAQLIGTEYTYDQLLKDKSHEYLYADALQWISESKSKNKQIEMRVYSPVHYKLSKKEWAEVYYEVFDMFDDHVLKNRGANQHFIYTKYLSRARINDFGV